MTATISKVETTIAGVETHVHAAEHADGWSLGLRSETMSEGEALRQLGEIRPWCVTAFEVPEARLVQALADAIHTNDDGADLDLSWVEEVVASDFTPWLEGEQAVLDLGSNPFPIRINDQFWALVDGRSVLMSTDGIPTPSDVWHQAEFHCDESSVGFEPMRFSIGPVTDTRFVFVYRDDQDAYLSEERVIHLPVLSRVEAAIELIDRIFSILWDFNQDWLTPEVLERHALCTAAGMAKSSDCLANGVAQKQDSHGYRFPIEFSLAADDLEELTEVIAARRGRQFVADALA